MKIIGIKDIIRKDVPIYYKRFYKGILVLEMLNKQQETPLEFIIEHKPTGQLEITTTLTGEVDYPLVPLMKELKAHIGELDETRKLPS
jgi:hypothetical protein